MASLCASACRSIRLWARREPRDVSGVQPQDRVQRRPVAMSPSPSPYGAVARLLHWTMFALITVQVVGGFAIEWFPRDSPARVFVLDWHVTLGIVALLLALARIARRLVERGRPLAGPRWQRTLASAAHGALYALMVAVPLVGYALADARGRGIPFFGMSAPEWLA